jgi:hypothetical protein
VSFRLLYKKILTSLTVIIECSSWLINVTDNNDARWKPEINLQVQYVWRVQKAIKILKGDKNICEY